MRWAVLVLRCDQLRSNQCWREITQTFWGLFFSLNFFGFDTESNTWHHKPCRRWFRSILVGRPRWNILQKDWLLRCLLELIDLGLKVLHTIDPLFFNFFYLRFCSLWPLLFRKSKNLPVVHFRVDLWHFPIVCRLLTEPMNFSFYKILFLISIGLCDSVKWIWWLRKLTVRYFELFLERYFMLLDCDLKLLHLRFPFLILLL